MARIELSHVTKRWGGFYAVDDLDLIIEDNAFVTLLGPSGCGKTTTLRMIAGLETPTSGRITIDGVTVFDSDQGINIPANKRRVGFLFQNYALWPNMTVYQNISFGLSNIKEAGLSVNENGEIQRNPEAGGAVRKLTKEEIDKIILTQSTRFFTTISQKNPDYEQFFYHEKFNRVPKVPKQRSLKSILRDFEKLRQEAWLTLISREPVLGEKQEALESRVEVLLVTPEGLTEGEYRLFWNKDEEGFFKLIGLTFHPRACGLIASYLEQITPAIQSMVDKWAKAWSEADLEGYLSCYTEKAVQQGRRGLAAIRRQKEKLWAESKPGTINFTGLRVMYQKSRFCVDMEQTYKSEEKTERGLKILYVEYDGTNWRINEEDWRALPKLNN